MIWALIAGALFLGLCIGMASARRNHSLRVRRFREQYVPTSPIGARRRKVLIISTTLIRDNGELLKQGRLWLPALNIGLLAALTPPEWEPVILYETIEEIPWDTDADLVALSCMGIGLVRGIQIAERFRALGKTVVIGGPMASIAPERVAAHCDAVCIGDAELLWGTILRDFQNGQLKSVYSDRARLSCLEAEGKRVHLLADIPVPRYDLMSAKKIGYWLPVLVGRGCPHRCEFCSINAYYGGRYLRRPVADVVRDVMAVKTLGFNNVLLIDDNIGSDPKYAQDLCVALQALQIRWMGQCAITVARQPKLLAEMAASGCLTLSVGLESVNQGSLNGAGKVFARANEYDRLLKVIAAAGIDVSSEMILGMDEDGPDTFERTADFVLRNKIRVPRFYVLTPIPGTSFHERMTREGRIFDENYGRYSATRAVFTPRKMTSEQLEKGYWELYEKIFSFKNLIRRFLARPSPRRLAHTLFLLGVNLHYRGQIKRRICPGVL